MEHIFTVDVEDWYHGFPPEYPITSDRAPRLEQGMNFLLDALEETGAQATFFWVGREAEAYPALVRATARRGHEIGCHSYEHRPIFRQSPKEFEADTSKAVDVITEITGNKVVCYRAPFFSIRNDTSWALEILASLGITHDSSILPMRHWRTGMPEANPSIHHIPTSAGTIIEVPVAIRSILGLKIPASGGGYFRIYPYELTKRNIAAFEAKSIPAVFYTHPWEMDEGHPHLPGFGIREMMHYAGLRSARVKLIKLLRSFSFGPMKKTADLFLAEHQQIEPIPVNISSGGYSL